MIGCAVGAVVLDCHGNVACAGSACEAGANHHVPGEIDCTSLACSGAYADNAAGACVVTGGNGVTRTCAAKRVVTLMDKGTQAHPLAAVQIAAFMRYKIFSLVQAILAVL